MSLEIGVYYGEQVMWILLLIACELGLEPIWQTPEGKPGKPEFEDSADTGGPDDFVANNIVHYQRNRLFISRRNEWTFPVPDSKR
jgi:hypothetical protein